jgi:hypothetical protein
LNRQSVYGDAQPFQAYSSALHHRARAEQAKVQCGCLEPLEVLTVRPVGLLDQRQLQSATPRVANVQQTCSRHEPRHRAICRLNGLKATDNMRYQSDEMSVVRDFETGGGVNQERLWRIMVDVTRLVCGEATDGFGWSCV